MGDDHDDSLDAAERDFLEWYAMQAEADSDRLTSTFYEQLAHSTWESSLALIEEYCLARFDHHAEYALPLSISIDSIAINPRYEERLRHIRENCDRLLRQASEPYPTPLRDELLSRVNLRLEAGMRRWLARAKDRQLARTLKNTTAGVLPQEDTNSGETRAESRSRRSVDVQRLAFAPSDPIDGNPFPRSDERHVLWAHATHQALTALHACQSRIADAVLLTPDGHPEWLLQLVAQTFDIWARRYFAVVADETAVAQFEQWLSTYAESWLTRITQTWCDVRTEPLASQARLVLIGRIEHWRAKALEQLEHLSRLPSGRELSHVRRHDTSLRSEAENQREARKRARRQFVIPRLEAKGLTPEQWALGAQVDRTTVFQYLSGNTRPRFRTLKKLAATLGVDAAVLPR